MKIKRYSRQKKRPDVLEVEVKTAPFHIWLDPQTRITIQRGDTLEEVVATVRPYYRKFKLKTTEIYELVAYWFTTGEKSHQGSIHDRIESDEVDIDPGRRYLR